MGQVEFKLQLRPYLFELELKVVRIKEHGPTAESRVIKYLHLNFNRTCCHEEFSMGIVPENRTRCILLLVGSNDSKHNMHNTYV